MKLLKWLFNKVWKIEQDAVIHCKEPTPTTAEHEWCKKVADDIFSLYIKGEADEIKQNKPTPDDFERLESIVKRANKFDIYVTTDSMFDLKKALVSMSGYDSLKIAELKPSLIASNLDEFKTTTVEWWKEETLLFICLDPADREIKRWFRCSLGNWDLVDYYMNFQMIPLCNRRDSIRWERMLIKREIQQENLKQAKKATYLYLNGMGD